MSNEKEQLNLFKPVVDEKKINEVLNMGTHESIILRDILLNGSTTVRDLLSKMNCPYSAIRDLQKSFGIPLEFTTEKRVEKVMKKGKEIEVTKPYRRYFLAKMEC